MPGNLCLSTNPRSCLPKLLAHFPCPPEHPVPLLSPPSPQPLQNLHSDAARARADVPGKPLIEKLFTTAWGVGRKGEATSLQNGTCPGSNLPRHSSNAATCLGFGLGRISSVLFARSALLESSTFPPDSTWHAVLMIFSGGSVEYANGGILRDAWGQGVGKRGYISTFSPDVRADRIPGGGQNAPQRRKIEGARRLEDLFQPGHDYSHGRDVVDFRRQALMRYGRSADWPAHHALIPVRSQEAIGHAFPLQIAAHRFCISDAVKLWSRRMQWNLCKP
nr:hypothetical protein CFP56_44454 [Quercus suber]